MEIKNKKVESLSAMSADVFLTGTPQEVLDILEERLAIRTWVPWLWYIERIFDNELSDYSEEGIELLIDFCAAFPHLVKEHNIRDSKWIPKRPGVPPSCAYVELVVTGEICRLGMVGNRYIFSNKGGNILPDRPDGFYYISTYEQKDYKLNSSMLDFFLTRGVCVEIAIVFAKNNLEKVDRRENSSNRRNSNGLTFG